MTSLPDAPVETAQVEARPDPLRAPSARPVRIVRYYPRALVGDGGITRSVWHHALELAGEEARIVIAHAEGSAPATPDGVELVPVRHLGWPWPVPVGLEDVLADADVLVLHSAWVMHNVRAGAVARRLGVPYVLEPRGAYDPRIVRRKRWRKRAWWWAMERRLVLGARGIHLFFESERPHLEALGYRGGIVVAPNGVEIHDEFRWDGGSGGYLLWYGRFDPEHKGIDLLVEAIHRLPPDTRPPTRLHGPDSRAGGKGWIRRRVSELGLDPWVKIGDAVYGDEKYALLAEAAAFAYPSRWEGFGNAAAEAASVGVPLLVTPYPLGRYLADRGAAILAAADPEALAAGIRRVLAPDARETGARATGLIRQEFTWSQVSRSWLAQVRALL